jgi:hypothetical protein
LNRNAVRTAAVAALVGLVVVLVPSVPAGALHNYCGATSEGVHLGNFAAGSKANGHPDGPNGGWGGLAGVKEAKRALLGLDRTAETLDYVINIAALTPPLDNIPGKVVALAHEVAKTALFVGKTAASAVVLHGESQNAAVNACNVVLMGDLIDTMFVATIEQDLADVAAAAAGHSPGEAPVPASTFMLPNDGGYTWSQHVTHDPALETAIPYVDGFTDEESIGVAVVVRNSIAHMKDHGIPTGRAVELWTEAKSLLDAKRYLDAYAKFAEAYREAVSALES